jgi:ankyrin repeat protein
MASDQIQQQQNTNERYALHDAVQHSDIERVQLLISQGFNLDELDELGNSPLHWAVMGGYYDIVKLLLEAKANPNVISDDGFTPTWSAEDFYLTEIADLLRSYGGKVRTGNGFNRTAWSILKGAMGQSLPKEDE